MLKWNQCRRDTVLDTFAGSGSTLIACEKMGRHARLIEIDPRCVDATVVRWQEFTGREATLEGDGRTFQELKSQRGTPVFGMADRGQTPGTQGNR